MTGFERTADRVAQEAARILRADVVVRRDGQELARTAAAISDSSGAPTASLTWDDEAGSLDFDIYQPSADMPEELTRAVVTLLIERETMRQSLSTSEEVKDRVLRGLLFDEAPDVAEIQRLDRLLNLHLERPRSVLLVDAPDYVAGGPRSFGIPGEDTRARRVRSLVTAIAQFFRLPDETICVHLDGGLIAVLKACTSADLAQWSGVAAADGTASWANLDALKRAAAELIGTLQARLGCRVDVAVGRYHPGLAGLHVSYEDCRLALQLGRLRRPGTMHSLDELGVSALLAAASDGTKRSLAARLISPLLHEPEILPTLHTFFAEDCSSNVTARKLAIHRNTLSYRLDKVAHLTGLDPRRFNDAVQLRISLELAESLPVQQPH